MEHDQKSGYGKRPLWQWIALYVVIGGALYAGVYYLFFAGKGGYNYNMPAHSSTSTTYGTQTTPQNNNAPVGSQTVTPPVPSKTFILSTMTSAVLGQYLVATNGMTLYTFNNDTPGKSNCSGQCAVLWPPYTVSTLNGLVVGSNIKGTVGTIKRLNGTSQITYNGAPLYFWSNDVKPGDTTGENVGGFVVAKP